MKNIIFFVKANFELNCSNLLVITDDNEGEEEINERKITYKSLWKWLIE